MTQNDNDQDSLRNPDKPLSDGLSRRSVLRFAGGGATTAVLSGLPEQVGAEPEFVDILSIDPTDYPNVKLNLSVDTSAGRNGELTRDAFEILENGAERLIQSFSFTSAIVDLVFVFDDTGSMFNEIGAMKREVKNLADRIDGAGIDARYSLVTFKDDITVDLQFTDDVDTLQESVDGLRARGGGDGPEDNFDAIEEAIGFDYRSDAQKVIVDITDNVSHYEGDGSGFSEYTIDEVATDLSESGITYIAVAPDRDDPRASKKILAERVGGRWLDIRDADFDVILNDVIELVITAYVLEYVTEAAPGGSLDVVVEVTDPEAGTDRDTGTVVVPPDAGGGNGEGPTASFTVSPSEPLEQKEVTFDGSSSSDPDGSIASYEWDLDGDGNFEREGESITYIYSEPGDYSVTLRVIDDGGAEAETTETVSVTSFEQLADRYAPNLHFGKFEKWYPTDPRQYIEEGTTVDGVKAMSEYERDPPEEPTVFYHINDYEDCPLVAIQYWKYYVFDQFSVNFHWHDWEVYYVFISTRSLGPGLGSLEPLLLVGSAHSRSITNNEYALPTPEATKPAGILAEAGAHASALDVNDTRTTFERFGPPPDITNAVFPSLVPPPAPNFAYGLPRSKASLPYLMPVTTEGELLYDKYDGIEKEDFIESSPPSRSHGITISNDDTGAHQYELTSTTSLDEYNVGVEDIDEFTGEDLEYDIEVPPLSFRGDIPDSFDDFTKTVDVPWDQERYEDARKDVTTPWHRAVLGAFKLGRTSVDFLERVIDEIKDSIENGIDDIEALVEDVSDDIEPVVREVESDLDETLNRIGGAVEEVTEGVEGELREEYQDIKDELSGIANVSISEIEGEAKAYLESEEPVGTVTSDGYFTFVKIEEGDHELTVNGPDRAPYTERFEYVGGFYQAGVGGSVRTVPEPTSIRFVVGVPESAEPIDEVRIVEDFAGVMYRGEPQADYRFAHYIHRSGQYTVEITDESGASTALRVDPEPGDEVVAVRAVETGKAATCEYLRDFLIETAKLTRKFSSDAKRTAVGFITAAGRASRAATLASDGRGDEANEQLRALRGQLESTKSGLEEQDVESLSDAEVTVLLNKIEESDTKAEEALSNSVN